MFRNSASPWTPPLQDCRRLRVIRRRRPDGRALSDDGLWTTSAAT